ncbi:hypothetical protein [Leptolyngbya sp. DQ-M1]|uniref:hypothetical protein n=1 Tax=Leptolyngbya sp. DQ-M1 TaxID=2933920 RepID=UPI00329A33BC
MKAQSDLAIQSLLLTFMQNPQPVEGQVKGVHKEDSVSQARFIEEIFGVSA